MMPTAITIAVTWKATSQILIICPNGRFEAFLPLVPPKRYTLSRKEGSPMPAGNPRVNVVLETGEIFARSSSALADGRHFRRRRKDPMGFPDNLLFVENREQEFLSSLPCIMRPPSINIGAAAPTKRRNPRSR